MMNKKKDFIIMSVARLFEDYLCFSIYKSFGMLICGIFSVKKHVTNFVQNT